ncbi:SGNH/GDSL hydrolase family protein [Actinokineospora sp. HUAS TT18]|uniref:SGNH/GDSL hydrolase family protein n=1 Tax=Actinokineospora sp. HUAS TT18 TaxID=3447451 RepID=UPI003F51CAD2
MRRIALTFALAVAASAATGLTAEAAPTAPVYKHYVALGDSFSAGPLIPWQQASWCFRSNNNYPAWLATKLGLYYTSGAFTDVTCSSADTTNMAQPQVTPSPDIPMSTQSPQFDALSLDTDLITIGIGGNDYSVFGSLVGTCPGLRASNPTGSPCQEHFTVNGVDTLSAALVNTQKNLENVIKGARAHSPGAKIVMVGYPRLVPPTGTCPDVVPFADGDYRWADAVERKLNAAVANAARRQGALYVDTYGPSLGHDACAGDAAWVAGQYTNVFGAAAYHPNLAGMKAEADLIHRALGGTSSTLALKPSGRNAATKAEVTTMARYAGEISAP